MESCKWCSWRSGYFTKLFYMFLHKIANTIGFRPGRCHTLRVPWWCWCHHLHTNSNEIANTFFLLTWPMSYTESSLRAGRRGRKRITTWRSKVMNWWRSYDEVVMILWQSDDHFMMIFWYGSTTSRRGRKRVSFDNGVINDDDFMIFDDAMIFWWWYRCEERYADVDVHPGEEDREGGVERTVQVVWEQKFFFLQALPNKGGGKWMFSYLI